MYIGNYIIYGLSLKCYGIVYTVLHIWVLLFTVSSLSLYLMCRILCTLSLSAIHLLKRNWKNYVQCPWMSGWMLATLM